MSGMQSTDTVSHVHPIDAPSTSNGPLVDGEGDGVALTQGYHFRARLHPRALFGQDELTASEVAARLRQEKCHLNRKHKRSVEILVKAVVVSGAVLEQQRRGPHLAGIVAAPDELGMVVRESISDSH